MLERTEDGKKADKGRAVRDKTVEGQQSKEVTCTFPPFYVAHGLDKQVQS